MISTRYARIMAAAGLLAAGTALAQKADTYVLKSNDEKIEAMKITADGQGTLKVFLDNSGAALTLRRDMWKQVFTPKPAEVAAQEKSLEGKDWDGVLRNSPVLFGKLQYLGWGGYVCYMEGMAQIGKGNADGALQAAERGLALGDQHAVPLMRAKVMALSALKRNPEAVKILDKMVSDADPQNVVFAFNTRGRMYAEQGKKREAVLEYLKTLMLFKPNQAKAERDEARTAAVALLKELNDSRAADIEKMP